MFGDPTTNPKHWNTKAITELCENIMGGGTPSKSKPEYFEGTIPWVSPKDMKSLFILDSQDHITEDAVNNSSAKKIKSDSILMVIRSGILKHTLPVAMNKVEVTINQDMKVFIPSSEINPYYLLFYFTGIERDVLSGVRAVTADNIDFNQFKKRHVILPPKQMQDDFASFVQQIDKSKFAVQKSLEKTEILYKSLMQTYFG
ncbi:MAG: restriction endonuclease subunit S [Spirochaetales bacterium]|nr:restriction endonuclease subunit S [Spirochaetales bacterium]